MRFTSRMAVLAAALSLPLGAALASYALAADPPSPSVPADGVEIGENLPDDATGTGSTPPPTTTTPKPPKPPPPKAPPPRPNTQVVPPAPPYSDDDGGDDDDDSDDDDGDD